MALKVNVRHLEQRDVELRGELPPAELELGATDELVRVNRPLHYDLQASKTGRDILVQGTLEMTVDCECSRCLKPFPHRIAIDAWTSHVPLDGPEKAEIKDDCVDLTPFVREDILLEYPQHPLCDPQCAGLPKTTENKSVKQKKGGVQPAGSPVWSELNKLKF